MRTIKPEVTWKISLASIAKTNGFENSVNFIKKLFENLVSENSHYVVFKKEHRPKHYEYNVQKWQHDKMDEIAKKTIEGLFVSEKDGVVSYELKYEIGFPSDWNKRDVQEWVVDEGPGEVPKAHIFNFTEDLVAGKRKRDELYISENELVNNLMKGLKIIEITKK
jgi:hypothetical protein